MRTKIIIFVAAPFAALIVYAFTYTNPYGELCEKLGGKWASVPSSCVTRLCYRSGTCGYWANPAARCHLLRVNDTISEVYFQLGEPDIVKGTLYMWHERKGRPIEVIIEHSRLSSLTCDQ